MKNIQMLILICSLSMVGCSNYKRSGIYGGEHYGTCPTHLPLELRLYLKPDSAALRFSTHTRSTSVTNTVTFKKIFENDSIIQFEAIDNLYNISFNEFVFNKISLTVKPTLKEGSSNCIYPMSFLEKLKGEISERVINNSHD